MKVMIRNVSPYAILYRDNVSGIAWIEDGSTGLDISVHPNISATGSDLGMKSRGYWDKTDRIVSSHGWKYNIDRFVCRKSNELEQIVANECNCQACIERRLYNIKEEFDLIC